MVVPPWWGGGPGWLGSEHVQSSTAAPRMLAAARQAGISPVPRLSGARGTYRPVRALRSARQTFSRVAGMSMCLSPVRAYSASTTALITAGGAADRARLAGALHAERVRRCTGTLWNVAVERRHVVGARHRVVHERAGEELAGLRVVDPRARAAPGRRPAPSRRGSGPRAAAGSSCGRSRRRSCSARSSSRRCPDRPRPRRCGSRSGRCTSRRLARVRRLEPFAFFATSKSDTPRSVPAIQYLPSRYSTSAAAASSRLAAVSLPFPTASSAAVDRRDAADREEAAAAGQPVRDDVGVALHHLDRLGVDAELVGQHLLEARDVPLAVVLHARDQRHLAVAADLQRDRVAVAAAAALDVHRRARCRAACRASPRPRAAPRSRPSRPSACASFIAPGEVAAVVLALDRRLVREGRR